ncbi:MAG TPA: ABC transporter substrate-binding protein [Solirubrobacteraceae bacterium]|nr:ABC transporter substrate-binding protein [Solirubrobacteraceae bacterium]
MADRAVAREQEEIAVRRNLVRGRVTAVLGVAALTTALVVGVTSSSGAASTSVSQSKGGKSVCGLGNGKKATGSPIKLGAINTQQPGTDFTDIGLMAKAYFDCVNANGGIYGHRIAFTEETESTTAQTASAAAKKLIEGIKVVGLVGNSSIIEADINHKYYEQKGFYVIGAGIAVSAYSTSHFASINMGPRYSSDGAAQWALSKKPDKLIFDQSNVPGTGYNAGGVALIAKKYKVPYKLETDNVPIQDGKSVAQRLVQDAGKNGVVVLNFTPPEALKILQGAQQQGLQDDVKAWACSTPCNTDFLAASLGPGWYGKLGVNAELNLTSAKAPDSALYRSVLKQYGKAVKGGLGSFSQMGFTAGRIATQALLDMGPNATYTAKTVNAAFKAVKDFKTDILCKPWYYGKGSFHLPNNTDRTVTPSKDGKVMVQLQGCFGIDPVDPEVAAARKIEAKQ